MAYFPILRQYNLDYETELDIWESAIRELYVQYDLPPLFVWEDGFHEGEATEEEMKVLETKLGSENVLDLLNELFAQLLWQKLDEAPRQEIEIYRDHEREYQIPGDCWH